MTCPCSFKRGLTGFWQVNGRSEAGLDGQEALDTYLHPQLVVMAGPGNPARTPWTVLFGKEAY